MKKLLLIPFTLLCISGFSQPVPNGDFESWSTTLYVTPDLWYTSNEQALTFAGITNVTEVAGHTNNAVHLETYIIGTDTLGAYISNTAGDPTAGEGGVPYSDTPTQISGFFRCDEGATDSAILLVIFKKAGTVISFDLYPIGGTHLSFTSFSFPVSLPMQPDTVIIAAASSNLITNQGVLNGSFIEFDDLAFTGPGVTQAIPDGGFEQWSTHNIDMPGGWETTGSVTKTTDAHSGTYAIRLETIDQGNGPSSSGITSGHFGQFGSFGGQPYSEMSDTLTGFYKYLPSGVDTGVLFVELFAAGNPVGGGGINLLPSPSYVNFEIPFSAGSAPDTLLIEAFSSTFPFQPTSTGSALYLDGLQLKSTMVQVRDLQKQSLTCYPNPVNKYLVVKPGTGTFSDVALNIRDVSGKIVYSNNYEHINRELILPVEALEAGIYFVEMCGQNITYSGKFVKN